MKKASLGTLFLTVFLDLLGYGLVVPFLPAIAREYGASDSLAALIGTAYSLMQFLFIPVWGRLSDRWGRRPILLVSIAAAALSMGILGVANSLILLFAARILSGVSTANIAVAQAYIADITTPENRAKGMGVIGMGFGLGFVFGPFVGGELESLHLFARPGALPALVASALSLINLFLAWRNLPESLPVETRGARVRSASPLSLRGLRQALTIGGLAPAFVVNFLALLAFSGMEMTFALFSADAYGMGEKQTGHVLGFVGLILVIVQGGLIRLLSKTFGESKLIRSGVFLEGCAFVLMGLSPELGTKALAALFFAAGLIAVANGFINPSVPSYVSRLSSGANQGTSLGALQSLAALARVLGPAVAGTIYQAFGYRVMFEVLGGILLVATAVALGLRNMPTAPAAKAEPIGALGVSE